MCMAHVYSSQFMRWAMSGFSVSTSHASCSPTVTLVVQYQQSALPSPACGATPVGVSVVGANMPASPIPIGASFQSASVANCVHGLLACFVLALSFSFVGLLLLLLLLLLCLPSFAAMSISISLSNRSFALVFSLAHSFVSFSMSLAGPAFVTVAFFLYCILFPCSLCLC